MQPLIGGSFDTEEQSLIFGAEWEITGKTTGTVKVGQLDKDFDAASPGKPDLNNWKIESQWSPRTYSTVLLSSSQLRQETNGTGDFVDSWKFSVLWLHDWSDRVHTSLFVGRGTDKFLNDQREDDLTNAGITVSYDFRRWIDVGLGYSIVKGIRPRQS